MTLDQLQVRAREAFDAYLAELKVAYDRLHAALEAIDAEAGTSLDHLEETINAILKAEVVRMQRHAKELLK